MKRITVVMKDDAAADAWLNLLKVGDVLELKIEDVAVDQGPPRAQAGRQRGGPVHREGISLPRLMEKHFGVLKHFYLHEAQKFALDRGYAKNTASATIGTLVRHKLVGRRDSDGMYYFLKPIPETYKSSEEAKDE